MKVWVDITNSPHAHFFKGVIKELEKTGHEVLITTREFDGLTGILDMLGFDYYVVGKHGGATLEGKLIASSERVYKLSKLIIEEKPDLALYKHSAEAPRVAFGLQIPSIGFVDNETAVGQNKLIMPFTRLLLYPKAIDAYELLKCGADPNGMKAVNGFSELAHLYGFRPSTKVLKELGLRRNGYIVMRTEPIKANYFNGDTKSVLEDVIPLLPEVPIVLFPRTEEQRKRLEVFDNVIIPDHPVDSLSLLYYAKLMIGAGGTMNREAIALGTPTISTYPGRLLAVTRWLVDLGVKFHSTDPLEVSEIAERLIELNGKYRNYIRSVVSGLENPMDVILKEIETYETEGKFFVSPETSNVGSYVSLDKRGE
jgi:predicted glycosyltransferase